MTEPSSQRGSDYHLNARSPELCHGRGTDLHTDRSSKRLGASGPGERISLEGLTAWTFECSCVVAQVSTARRASPQPDTVWRLDPEQVGRLTLAAATFEHGPDGSAPQILLTQWLAPHAPEGGTARKRNLAGDVESVPHIQAPVALARCLQIGR